MCRFYSAIVLRNGDVLDHDASDSHTDLIRHYKLPDDRECRHFAKVEFVPADAGRVADVSGYTLHVDEDTEPSWWPEVRDRVEATCRARVGRMVLDSGKVDLLLGGRWILAGDVEVGEIKGNAVVVAVGGSARIDRVGGSARIDRVWDSARIVAVGGSARIDCVGDSARIDAVWDSARIVAVGGSARIGHDYRRAVNTATAMPEPEG